ncbi:hypothetical protein K440DRAFT_606855 [Wilcoxina mikolae CBS 423.85]|nr:hypothetical protein K440DRAFT_606855 [Wilcoxina mikolae CBS 423.85]
MLFVDNFYTTDPTGEFALKQGYRFLGIVCYVFNTQVSDTVPVYRCVKPFNGDHYYTTSRAIFDNSIKHHGFRVEHIGWFMFEHRQCRSIALKQYYNRESQDHLYCTDGNIGKAADLSTYIAEGVAGYVFDDNKYTRDETRVVPLYWWHYKASEREAQPVLAV